MIDAVIVVSRVAQVDTSAVFIAVGLLVLAAALLAAALIYRRSKAQQQKRDWHRRLNQACQEAKAIVDLTTPIDEHDEPLTTHGLRSVADRVERLNGRLEQLAVSATGVRLAEAIEDLRRVSSSLGAALDAERSLRVEPATSPIPHRAKSWARVAKRSSELDLAANELLALAGTAN